LSEEAENIQFQLTDERVHSIYVVNKEEKLIGRLSLKDLIVAKSEQKISDLVKVNVDYVNVHDDVEEVAKVMAKYDLEAIPVIDENKQLVGRITIDDIVDVLKEEADKDYQMAAGITGDVEADDSILELTRARLPWLFLGLVGGIGAFIIMAMFLFLFVWAVEGEMITALAISVSLVAVIIVAGLIGTFVPLFLNKRGIDPAIATGPFITTSNDILGILLYFWIAKMIL